MVVLAGVHLFAFVAPNSLAQQSAGNAEDMALIRDVLHRTFARLDPGVPSLIQYETKVFGELRRGDSVLEEWKNTYTGRVVDAEGKFAFSSTEAWWNRFPDGTSKDSERFRHTFWDGERGFNYQTFGPHDNPKQKLATLQRTGDYRSELRSTARHGGAFLLGYANFADYTSTETWPELFERHSGDWKIESGRTDDGDTLTVSFSDGLWTYSARMADQSGRLELVEITGERGEAPEIDNRKRHLFSFKPLEYEVVDGIAIIKSGRIDIYTTMADGSVHYNSHETTRKSIRLNPEESEYSDLFRISAPDGTVVKDKTYPGIRYVVRAGELLPFFSVAAAEQIDVELDKFLNLDETKETALPMESDQLPEPKADEEVETQTMQSSRLRRSTIIVGVVVLGLLLFGGGYSILTSRARAKGPPK